MQQYLINHPDDTKHIFLDENLCEFSSYSLVIVFRIAASQRKPLLLLTRWDHECLITPPPFLRREEDRLNGIHIHVVLKKQKANPCSRSVEFEVCVKEKVYITEIL